MAWRLRFYRGCLSNFRLGGGLGTTILRPGGQKQSEPPDHSQQCFRKSNNGRKGWGSSGQGGLYGRPFGPPLFTMLSPWLKYVRCEEVGRSILDNILFNTMFNLANCPVYHCRCHFLFESRAVLILSQRPQYIKNAYSRAELFSHWQRFLKMTASLSFNSSLYLYSD